MSLYVASSTVQSVFVRLTSFKPGSALSILKLLPLLDPVEDDGQDVDVCIHS